MDLPTLNHFRAFEAVARHLSMSAAATELCVTHGAVSRQVGQLEQAVGFDLFLRVPRGVSLTPAGRVLYGRVRESFGLLHLGLQEARSQVSSSPLVVSCTTTFCMRWLMPRLADFQERHPEMEIRLSPTDDPSFPPREDTDLSIRVGPRDWPLEFERTAFLSEDVGPVASPSTLSSCPLESHEDLSQVQLLHTESRPTAWADWCQAVGIEGVDVSRGTHFGTFYLLLQAVSSGLGVGIGPSTLVAEDIQAGQLVAPFGMVPSGRSMFALYRPGGSDQRVTRFRDWLVEAGGA